MMTPVERLARLTQLREQVKALTEEIARLEAEDEGYVQHHQRSQLARRPPLSYADYVKYASAFTQYQTAWTRAGMAPNWPHLSVLLRLRDVLLEPAPAAAPVAAGATATPAAVRAAPSAPVPAPRTGVATATTPPVPTPAGRVPGAGTQTQAAPPPPSRGPAATSANRSGGGSAPRAPVPEQTYTQSQLAEMHSPILNEVGDLTKRAEEEFRTSQGGNALSSVERATFLLERVAKAPNAMSTRLLKVLDDGLKEGSIISEVDRARREQVRERITKLTAEDD
jgi:hypothetical protein